MTVPSASNRSKGDESNRSKGDDMLQGLRCKLGRHRWGPLEGDNWGGYHTCTYCGASKRFKSEHPPEAHDHLGINK